MALKHLITCVVAGIDYLVHPTILGSVEESVRADQIVPVVVLSEDEVNAGPGELWDTLHYLVDHDDVCTDEFTGIIVVKPSASGTGSRDEEVPDGDATVLSMGRASSIAHVSSIYHLAAGHVTQQGMQELPSGPYFLSGQNLHQAWRLYPDDLEAFTFGLIPDNPYEPQSFQAVTSQSSNGFSKTIPVPSRFYHHPSPKKPLAGTRISLGDVFDAEGVKTTLSSRDWAGLYPAVNTSASYVKELLGLGAVIVGKTKTTQFATSGGQWVDVQSPVNPRGDRYQLSSGSSAGAAASLAGYGWLDYAVGGDAAGSIRESAALQGLYAIRPTFGSVSLDGVKLTSPRYDTVGLLGRSLGDLVHVAKHSIGLSDEGLLSPQRIIYPADFFPLPEPSQQKLAEEFVAKLEGYLGFKKTEVSLVQSWQDNPPSEPSTAGESLRDYLKKAPFWSLCYEYCQAMEQFRFEYREQSYREPFVEATPSLYWALGAGDKRDDYDVYLAQLKTFRTWFDKTIMSLSHEQSDDAVMVLPCVIHGPQYRDQPPDLPSLIEGVDFRLLSPMLGLPHIVVPFAQTPYVSRITGEKEYQPFCIALMGGKGSDLGLLRLAEETLRAAGWRTDIDTGRYTFPVGRNSRHVKDKQGNGGGGLGAAPVEPQHAIGVMGTTSREPLDEL